MIEQNQHIMYLSQTSVAVVIKKNKELATGFLDKKIVITSRRCLFFECLDNIVNKIEFESIVKAKKQPKKEEKVVPSQKKTSINGLPEHSFHVSERQSKILVNEEPSCMKYLQLHNLQAFIKSTIGIVILKNKQDKKFELMSFNHLKEGFRFCKSLICAQAWALYETYCREHAIEINYLWIRIVSELGNNEKSATLIDPDLFISGSIEQMKSFTYLISQIPFAHTFQHRYLINSEQICRYGTEFLETFQNKTHSLMFTENLMQDHHISLLLSPTLKMNSLMSICLARNKLTDYCFHVIERLIKQSHKLYHIDLEKNFISLDSIKDFISLLKKTKVSLSISLQSNLITDRAIKAIEKNIIFAQNPPIEELNLSYNEFSMRGAWRLFVGNNRFEKYHPLLNFVIYPIPINSQTFPKEALEYPLAAPMTNFNVNSTLIDYFEQQSFMKYTLQDNMDQFKTIIRFVKITNTQQQKKIPKDKNQLYQALQFGNRIENFTYNSHFVEEIADLAYEISEFKYTLPPVACEHFIKFMSDKLNEALFIRDHYAVKYILMAFRYLDVKYDGYTSRINKVISRNEIIREAVSNIMNFQMDEGLLNNALDEMVKEGLRLYLSGSGIEILYYLKFCRDNKIQKMILKKYNPETILFEKMAKQNIEIDEVVLSRDLLVPFEIRVEKDINENLYMHPWQANYVILSQIQVQQFQRCSEFIAKSVKREKFTKYFQRIQQRIDFLQNQFNLFSFGKFRIAGIDLKINCARLLGMYRYLADKHFSLQIPFYPRKKPITKERYFSIGSKEVFMTEYHISKYLNISSKARKFGFYNYQGQMTRYTQQQFMKDFQIFNKLCAALFYNLERAAPLGNNFIPSYIISNLLDIIKEIRFSSYPEAFKEEFYLKILSWRNGKHMSNYEIMQYLPFITMYIKPPLTLEKYIVAAILQNKKLNLPNMPLCLVTDPNKATTEDFIKNENSKFVERDWIGPEGILKELMINNGSIELKVQLMSRREIVITVPESKTIVEIIVHLISVVNEDISDLEHFWLYMGYSDSKEMTILEGELHIGEIMSSKASETKNGRMYFVFKRRIYSLEWKYIYRKYSHKMISEFYQDFKFEYLYSNFFINDEITEDLAVEMFMIDLMLDYPDKKKMLAALADKMGDPLKICLSYIPPDALKRSMKTQEEIVREFENKVNEKILRQERKNVLDIQTLILSRYDDYPEVFSSRYTMTDKNNSPLKVAINSLYINLQSSKEYVKLMLEKIISIIPKKQYLLLYYHKEENMIDEANIFGTENKILAIAHDLLTYCSMRVRTISSSVYTAYRYEQLKIMRKEADSNYSTPSERKKLDKNISQMFKKLEYLNPTIISINDIIYANTNRYVKMRPERKLYTNIAADELELDVLEEEPENFKDWIEEAQAESTRNVFKVLFPKVNDKEEGEDRANMIQNGNLLQHQGLNEYRDVPPMIPIEELTEEEKRNRFQKQYDQILYLGDQDKKQQEQFSHLNHDDRSQPEQTIFVEQKSDDEDHGRRKSNSAHSKDKLHESQGRQSDKAGQHRNGFPGQKFDASQGGQVKSEKGDSQSGNLQKGSKGPNYERSEAQQSQKSHPQSHPQSQPQSQKPQSQKSQSQKPQQQEKKSSQSQLQSQKPQQSEDPVKKVDEQGSYIDNSQLRGSNLIKPTEQTDFAAITTAKKNKGKAPPKRR